MLPPLTLVILTTVTLLFFVFVGRRLQWWWKGFVAAVLVVITGLILPIEPQFLGGPEKAAGWHVLSPYREMILFIVMLAGMMARMLSEAIEKRRGLLETRPNELVPLPVDRWEFVYPTLVAVPTFGAVLGQTSSEGLDLAILALAFQNGFFWQTILKRSAKTSAAMA